MGSGENILFTASQNSINMRGEGANSQNSINCPKDKIQTGAK